LLYILHKWVVRRNTSPDVYFGKRQQEILGYNIQKDQFDEQMEYNQLYVPQNKMNNYTRKVKKNQNSRKKYPVNNKEDIFMFSLNVERVLKDEDKRTTLMIKNIPNKYDQDSLLEAINEKYVGLYDFFLSSDGF